MALESQRLTSGHTDDAFDPFTPLFSSQNLEPDSKDEFDQKLSKLFKAINVGDVPLVAFYLGIDLVINLSYPKMEQTLCTNV